MSHSKMITKAGMLESAIRDGDAYIVAKDTEAGHFVYYLLVVVNSALTGLTGPAFASAFNHVPVGGDADDTSTHVWRFPASVYEGAMSLLDE